MYRIFKMGILTLMILNGLFFISNIYVLGNVAAAIKMHNDLAPSAGALMANAKVIVCFITGILYLVSAAGIIRERYRTAMAGMIAFVLFDGLYIIELTKWGTTYPRVWANFGIFGGLGLLFGIYSWWNWRKRCLT